MIKTAYHGNVHIEQPTLTFQKGLPGFPDQTAFIVLPLPEADMFHVLQSTHDEEVAFVMTEPFQFFPDYDFQLDDATTKQLGLENGSDAAVYVILTMNDNVNHITANLQAPIIINTKNHQAKQVILNNLAYKTKHALFQPVNK
jgi:flagellar assembly factor FliW